MKLIPLTQGQFAKVDDEDFELLSAHKWYAWRSHHAANFYAKRNVREVSGNGRQTTLIMHRVIMGANKGEEVDHENHDTLDNRRKNLRRTTHQGNCKNMSLLSSNTSGACGVRWCKRAKRWHARIKINGREVHLGFYADKDDAIEARKAANARYGFHANHGMGSLESIAMKQEARKHAK